jgi:hypothetical protein
MEEKHAAARRQFLETTAGGPKNNRLYMTACHSVYALYVESHGAV